jgi:hypothetical protein
VALVPDVSRYADGVCGKEAAGIGGPPQLPDVDLYLYILSVLVASHRYLLEAIGKEHVDLTVHQVEDGVAVGGAICL